MNANDKTEKVLREIHIMLSKAEPYKPEPSRVIINKQQMIDLLAELNKCIYAIQDEYELTEQSRNHAEREFRKKGDQIVWRSKILLTTYSRRSNSSPFAYLDGRSINACMIHGIQSTALFPRISGWIGTSLHPKNFSPSFFTITSKIFFA